VGDDTFPNENGVPNRSLKSLVVLDCSHCTSYVDCSTVVALFELVVIFYCELHVNCLEQILSCNAWECSFIHVLYKSELHSILVVPVL
jgi:glycogen synthase